jgi:hypothetical protein
LLALAALYFGMVSYAVMLPVMFYTLPMASGATAQFEVGGQFAQWQVGQVLIGIAVGLVDTGCARSGGCLSGGVGEG